jgi:hypothetical protein
MQPGFGVWLEGASQVSSAIRGKSARSQARVSVRGVRFTRFAGEPALEPAGQTPPKVIPSAVEAVLELGQPRVAHLVQGQARRSRARSRTAADDQRVVGSEYCAHDGDKFRIAAQAVAVDVLPRYIESSRWAPECKFEFAPDVDVSISSID